MASLFKKPNSPFWYIAFKKEGKWIKKSTGLRYDDPRQNAEAIQLVADAEKAAAYRARGGWDWVQKFIEGLSVAPRSKDRYLADWRRIQMFVSDRKLLPHQIRYSHAIAYIDWRTTPKKHNKKKCGKNTAIQEVKFLSFVLTEAVARDIIPYNPLASLKNLKRDKPKQKPAMTDEEVDLCLQALEKEPEWMRVCFLIALHTGCRLRETRIPLSCISMDTEPVTMTFPTPKGGHAFTIPIPSKLRDLFAGMKGEFTIDKFPFQPSRVWQNFFKRVGLPHLCFHCLRVTKVTRMRREGVPREVAMRLVNHSSELIHLLYDRHRVEDLVKYADAGIAGGNK